MSDDHRIEEQALSQIAELGILGQLDNADAIAVDVRTDLGKIIQGQADSIALTGEGLVFQQEIRVESLDVQTDHLDINPFSALLGKIRLNHPVNTTTRLVMTEADLNQALNSAYVRSKLKPLVFDIEGQSTLVRLEPPLELHLLPDNRMQFSGSLAIEETEQTRQSNFSAVLSPPTQAQPVLLEAFQCPPGQGLPFELTFAFFKKIRELLHQPSLQWEDMVLRVTGLDIQGDRLTIECDASISQIPDSMEVD